MKKRVSENKETGFLRKRLFIYYFFYSDTEDRLIILGLTFSCGKTIRLVAINAAHVGKSDNFRDLQKFLNTSHSIVLLGDYSTILDARVDRVGSDTDRECNSGF